MKQLTHHRRGRGARSSGMTPILAEEITIARFRGEQDRRAAESKQPHPQRQDAPGRGLQPCPATSRSPWEGVAVPRPCASEGERRTQSPRGYARRCCPTARLACAIVELGCPGTSSRRLGGRGLPGTLHRAARASDLACAQITEAVEGSATCPQDARRQVCGKQTPAFRLHWLERLGPVRGCRS